MATNFGTTIDYKSALVKIIARCFYPHPYFRIRSIRWCYLNFFPADYCCHGNEFWDKIDYNSPPVKDNWSLFAPTSLFSDPFYPMVSFKFLPWRPMLSWQLTVFKTKLAAGSQERQTLKRAAARLYSVAMGHLSHSTERISNLKWNPTIWFVHNFYKFTFVSYVTRYQAESARKPIIINDFISAINSNLIWSRFILYCGV